MFNPVLRTVLDTGSCSHVMKYAQLRDMTAASNEELLFEHGMAMLTDARVLGGLAQSWLRDRVLALRFKKFMSRTASRHLFEASAREKDQNGSTCHMTQIESCQSRPALKAT